MLTRAVIVSVILLVGSVLIGQASHTEPVLLRQPLSALPLQIDGWRGAPAPPFDARVVRVLGVDEYVHRSYSSSSNGVASLYIGYYNSQRQGDTMHSPLNCMPGSGWEPMSRERLTLDLADAEGSRAADVNRLVIQKGADRQTVLYWYQSRGRVVASEYISKMFTILDAIRTHRTDGALVRVIVPIAGDETRSVRAAVAFTKSLYPHLRTYLPN
jgi:EpsI family protein